MCTVRTTRQEYNIAHALHMPDNEVKLQTPNQNTEQLLLFCGKNGYERRPQ